FCFSSRRRHTRCYRDWSSDVCSSDLGQAEEAGTHVEEDGLTGPERWIDGRQKHALYLAGSPDRPERDPPQRNATEVEAITRDLDHVRLVGLGDGPIEGGVGEKQEAVEDVDSHEDAADLLRNPEDSPRWIVLTNPA